LVQIVLFFFFFFFFIIIIYSCLSITKRSMRRSVRLASTVSSAPPAAAGGAGVPAKRARVGATAPSAVAATTHLSHEVIPARLLARRYDTRGGTDGTWCPALAARHLADADPRLSRHLAAHGREVAKSVIERRRRAGLRAGGGLRGLCSCFFILFFCFCFFFFFFPLAAKMLEIAVDPIFNPFCTLRLVFL
jgi:hypothetical protein